MPRSTTSLINRLETEINNYISHKVEISPRVKYSQYKTINRIYRFRNRDLNDGNKINDDLSYNYYFDIISPRVDSEIKNLRFDTKHILAFSQNPRTDFAAVFLANASLKSWMADNGEDLKLKTAIEEFVANGNVGFKRTADGYELIDSLNTFITNTTAESIDDTDIIERYQMSASRIRRQEAWRDEVKDEVIKNCGNKFFKSDVMSTENDTTGTVYEIFEFTGEVNEAEYNEVAGIEAEGDGSKYFLAKIVVCGLQDGDKSGERYVLFAEKLPTGKKLSDYYIYAHRGRYEGRFWRVGMYEMLFDHQVRCNQIGNDLARGLEWASKVIFKSADTRPLENIRADLDNGDIIHNAESLTQLEVRMQGVDQLIADWNRVQQDADRLANSYEVVRGENLPSGTAFRLGLLMDQNAGKFFVLLRQKISLPYKRVFREWILPDLLGDMKGKDIFRFTGDTEVIDQLRLLMVESWYADNLIEIGPHTQEVAETIKQEKFEELSDQDPVIENTKEIWEGVQKRLFVTITGEEYLGNEMIQDIMSLLPLEQDIERINFMLDTVYKIRGLNIPPKVPPRYKQQPGEGQESEVQPEQQQGLQGGLASPVQQFQGAEAGGNIQ